MKSETDKHAGKAGSFVIDPKTSQRMTKQEYDKKYSNDKPIVSSKKTNQEH